MLRSSLQRLAISHRAWTTPAATAAATAAASLQSPFPPLPGTQSRDLHVSAPLERARQMTRIRKRKIIVANTKKRAERLRKNPPKLPAKVVLMLKSKGLWGPIKYLRPQEKGFEFPKDNVYMMNHFCHTRHTLAGYILESLPIALAWPDNSHLLGLDLRMPSLT